jgi:GDP-L-fucose synthase
MSEASGIFVAGHRGLVGSALVRALERAGRSDLVLRTREQLDLTDQAAVRRFFASERIDQVYLAAARVGGIAANAARPAEFIAENLAIQTNVIDAAWRNGVRKLLFLGSSCVYPRLAPQPIREDALLTGPLEPTNEAYAVAKIAGIRMCQAYRRQYGFNAICLMPTNLYGPRDNFDPETAHVIPALIRKFHEAKVQGAGEVVVWGTGTPLREFLHVDDLADACLFLMQHYDEDSLINVGSGTEVTIRDLAGLMAEVVGYRGRVRFDRSRPDGAPRKRLDDSRSGALGWRPRIGLREGLQSLYGWFLEQKKAP